MKNMKKTKRRNEFYTGVMGGLQDAVAWAEGRDVPVTVREVVLPDPPRAMPAAEIVRLRSRKLHVSQAVFARLLGASRQTVHAWEQGRTRPTGPTLRFLRLLDTRPELVQDLAAAPK